MKNNYQFLAKFYDMLMGETYTSMYINLMKKCCRRRLIGLDILDIACGTGILLKRLSKNNHTIGIDISRHMIDIAKKKDRNSKYLQMDMTRLKLAHNFDIIICGYDSINHVLKFSHWKKIFEKVSAHLKDTGYFLFDFNTLDKFKKIDGSATVKLIRSDYAVMSTRRTGYFCSWKIKIFEHVSRNNFIVREEIIKEASFPEKKVLDIIKKIFILEKIIKNNGRIFLICKKKPG